MIVVRMGVSIYIYIYGCVGMCVCVYVYVYVCMCICICIYVYVYMYMCMCIYICVYVYVYMYMCMRVCVCVCVYVYVYMYSKHNGVERSDVSRCMIGSMQMYEACVFVCAYFGGLGVGVGVNYGGWYIFIVCVLFITVVLMDLCSYEHRKVREMRRKDNKTSELDGDNVRYSVVGAWMME